MSFVNSGWLRREWFIIHCIISFTSQGTTLIKYSTHQLKSGLPETEKNMKPDLCPCVWCSIFISLPVSLPYPAGSPSFLPFPSPALSSPAPKGSWSEDLVVTLVKPFLKCLRHFLSFLVLSSLLSIYDMEVQLQQNHPWKTKPGDLPEPSTAAGQADPVFSHKLQATDWELQCEPHCPLLKTSIEVGKVFLVASADGIKSWTPLKVAGLGTPKMTAWPCA